MVAETQVGCKITYLQSDNGIEFRNSKMDLYFEARRHLKTAAYSGYSEGVAEL